MSRILFRCLPAVALLAACATTRPASHALGRYDAHGWSASLGHGVTERVGAYVEAFGIAEARGGREARYANGGLTLAVHEALQLDLRAGGRLGAATGREFFAGVGIARRW